MQEQQQQQQHQQRPLPPLPAEILSPIFAHLPLSSLQSCILVSRLWYHESKPHLFGAADTFHLTGLHPLLSSNGSKTIAYQAQPFSPSYIDAIRVNKRYLRSATWVTRNGPYGSSIANALDTLFDCPKDKLPFSVDAMDSVEAAVELDRVMGAAAASPTSVGTAGYGTTPTTVTVPGIPLGPNRPALQEFVYVGEVGSTWLFETTVYNLPTLTSLELHLWCYNRDHISVRLDIDRILDTLPRLKSLVIDGYWHTYFDDPSVAAAVETTGQLHPLESFKFIPLLMLRTTPSTLATFRRLGNLKSVIINSLDKFYDPVRLRAQSGEFGQILRQYCPKIERIETSGSLALWLCRLPPLSLAFEEMLSSYNSGAGAGAGTEIGEVEEGLEMLRHQEREDILTDYHHHQENTLLFFPQLKTFIAQGYNTVGAQDLLALAAARSEVLTHLEVGRGNSWNNAFNILQDTRPSSSLLLSSPLSAQGIDQITVYLPGPMVDSEKRWMRRRRLCCGLDFQRVLETCSALRVLTLPGGINFRHMVDDSSCTSSRSSPLSDANQEVRATRTTRKWACEGTLETINMGFVLPTARREDHRLIWRHLGRLSKLRCLTLTHSNLIPSLDFGIDELVGRELVPQSVSGEGVGEGSSLQLQLQLREQNPTLEKIHSLGVAWGVDDRATVQWFARSFPNLQIAGLGFRWGKDQHKRVQAWLDEVAGGCSFELVFTNDLYRRTVKS